MRLANCPTPAQLTALFLGGLPEEEVAVLEQHVLDCPACFEILKRLYPSGDTLAGLLRDETAGESTDANPLLDNLIERLKALRPPRPPAPSGESAMFNVPCPSCRRTLALKEESAGDQVRCPDCGHVLVVPVAGPVPAASVGILDATLVRPPASQPVDPSGTAIGDQSTPFTPIPADRPQADPGVGAEHDPSLTEFLMPSLAADELGRLGNYRILKILGHGGMGVVFLAEDVRLKRKVALKAMLPALASSGTAGKRFLREAEAMAALKNDHVVTIYQVDEDRGVPYLAMEFLEGEPLDQRVEREKALPLGEVLRIGREIAQALEAAHATGLIHRDVKPANVWLEAPLGRVKILDFGLARVASQNAGLTQQGMIMGTPAYMAPEQARGEKLDARCDLFSLGCVLYRLSTGKLPFYANDSASTIVAVLTLQPEAPLRLNTNLPPEFSALVMRLLEKDRARRLGSATEVVEALRALEKQGEPERARPGEKTSPERPAERAPTAPRRRLPWLIGAAVLLLGLAGVGLWASGLIRFQTEQGDLVLDTDDQDFAFSVVKGGGVTLEDRKSKRTYHVKAVPQGKDEVELEVTDAGAELTFKTKKLTVKRGDKVVLSAWFERKTDQPKAVAAGEVLEAARWAFAQGSFVTIRKDGKEQRVDKSGWELKDFPPEPFTVVRLYMSGTNNPGQKKIEDADLARIAVCRDLEELVLAGQPITAAGLAHLAPLVNLKRLNLKATKVDPEEGARTVRGFSKLEYLYVDSPWLKPLEGMTSLRRFDFYRSTLSAEELGRLKQFPNLSCLAISDCQLAEKDLALLKEVKSLRQLILGDLNFGDDVVARLAKEMPACEIRMLRPGKPDLVWNAPPIEDAWLKQVAALPAEKQVEAVTAKLKERNPGWEGKVTPGIDKGVVKQLDIPMAKDLVDLSPVRALTGLKSLTCDNSRTLTDLSPLRGLQLQQLNFRSTEVSDLSPLQGMPLKGLRLPGTPVENLSPLKGMPLDCLDLWKTPVADLSLLKGMPLTNLTVGKKVRDLTPLAGMTSLTYLKLQNSEVTDLSALKGLPLTTLILRETKVTDLSPLQALPLKVLELDFVPERDTEILRSIKTLERINNKPAAEFWKTAEPKAVAAREVLEVARWAVDQGFALTIRKDGTDQRVRKDGLGSALKDVPSGPFTVVSLIAQGWNNQKQLADEDLARIAVWQDLEELDLLMQPVTAAGLAHLAPLKGLRHLVLKDTKVDPAAGAATVRGFSKLEHFYGSARWVQALEGMPSLRRLEFYRETLTADVLGRLKGFPNLACVSIQDCGLDGKDLLLLKDVKSLRLLLLDRRPHYGEDIHQRLAKEMPECEIRDISRIDYLVWNPGKGKEFYALAGVPFPFGWIEEAWLREVAALPAEKQVEAVAAKLLEHDPRKGRNLRFDGTVKSRIDNGVVTGLEFKPEYWMADLTPLRALAGLESLDCTEAPGLKDLSPLKGTKLKSLSCARSAVSDLSPLQGLALRKLVLERTQVADLTPLKGMPLEILDIKNTRVTDLEPLKGLPLREISGEFKPERDGAILRSIKTLEKINGKPAAEFLKTAPPPGKP
jgi:Leucine-rich repeat (LRR) protein